MHFIYETKVLYPKFFENKRWLEIGSANCYPLAKSHSKNCEWIGVDIEEGDNVDVACLGHHYQDNKLNEIMKKLSAKSTQGLLLRPREC